MSRLRLILVGLAVTVAAIALVPPTQRLAIEFVDWVHRQGSGAAVMFAALYAVASLLLVPGSVLTLGAGFIYGVATGTAIVFPAAVVASLVAFGIARRVAHDAVQRRVTRYPRFAAIDRAVGRAGLRITLLLRLSPMIPYGPLNYALGITRVRFRDYALATIVGMLPGTIAYVYLGSLVTSVSALDQPSGRGWVTWVGAAITVVIAWAVTAVGRRELQRELDEEPA